MADFSVQTTGIDEMLRRLEQIGPARRRQLHDALVDEAEHVLEEAKSRVPVETGALRDSGRVIVNEDLDVAIVFGGPDAPYAALVHEDPSAHHAAGEWKYLSTPALQVRLPEIADRIK